MTYDLLARNRVDCDEVLEVIHGMKRVWGDFAFHHDQNGDQMSRGDDGIL